MHPNGGQAFSMPKLVIVQLTLRCIDFSPIQIGSCLERKTLVRMIKNHYVCAVIYVACIKQLQLERDNVVNQMIQ